MKKGSIICIVLNIVCSIQLMGQNANKLIQTGNDLYKLQKYDQAIQQYNNALAKDPSSATARFNLANALYRMAKQDEAEKAFDDITIQAKEKALRSKAFYNKGVLLSLQKKLEESIVAYKNALRLNPDDKEARENLQKALLELKKKTPSPKKKERDKKKKQDEQQQKQQPQTKMSQKEAEQRLKLLEQKEKEVQQRLQKEKAKSGNPQGKDW